MSDARPSTRKQSIVLALLGIITVIGYGSMDLDIGGQHLTSAEAWRLGVVQPYLVGGVALMLLALLLSLGDRWVRWTILLWLPVTGGLGVFCSQLHGIGTNASSEFLFEGLPVVLIWLWMIWRGLWAQQR
jgi:hypothetical protein